MLGTIHRDKEGTGMLERWMKEIKPDVITLEFSRYGLNFRTAHLHEFQARVEEYARELESRGETINRHSLGNLLAYLHPPYEFDVASRYATGHTIPLYLIDMDFFSYLNLRRIDELLDQKNMEQLLTGNKTEENGERTLARLFFEKGVNAFAYSEEMDIRDRYMRDRLMTLIRCHKGSTILHVCGWRHLCDPQHVYAQLNPMKAFIYDRTVRI